MDANLHVQIANFGLTRLGDAMNAKHLNFSAPELFGCLGDVYNPSGVEPTKTQMSDVYAFGCLYYEVRHKNCTGALTELARSIMILYPSMVCKKYRS